MVSGAQIQERAHNRVVFRRREDSPQVKQDTAFLYARDDGRRAQPKARRKLVRREEIAGERQQECRQSGRGRGAPADQRFAGDNFSLEMRCRS